MAVQRWLGHHAASFTLDTYVHMLDADLGEPLQFEEIAADLNAQKVPPIHGTNRWTASSVRKAFVS